MRVGVDIDDVLFPWYDTAHLICDAAGITGGVTPTNWSPFEDYGCTRDEWIATLSDATLDGSLYVGGPYPGAVEALAQIKAAGHSIHLVTARGLLQHGQLIKAHTFRWVGEHVAGLVDSLTFSADKTVVPVDVFIDDGLRNYDAVDATGTVVYLVDRPWNQEPGDSRRRVESIGAFADLVVAYAAIT